MSYVIVDKKGDKYGVNDTKDGVVEYYTLEELEEFRQMGVVIKGKVSDFDQQDISGEIAKHKFLGHVVFEPTDTMYSANFKINHASKRQDKVFIVNYCNLQSFEDLFRNIDIKHLDLSQFDTFKIIDMAYMFGFCNFETADLSGMDTARAKNMTGMFYKTSVPELDLSNFITTSVFSMSGMFKTALIKKLNLSSFDTRWTQNISEMFSHCEIGYLDISNMVITDFCRAERVFYGSKIGELKINSQFKDKIDLTGAKISKLIVI